ncbi:MAG: hypothetical protein COB45_02105 [Gammaproteobacteria bacterium]|nr:MAG: hypothetical protein COB45_02105 [Gammaproteobacteria bacterium]PHR84806.1 MAG: hypothetical protein COA59_05390 [Colwellia sp.]
MGYLLVQLYALINKLLHTNMSLSVMLFSIIVVFIWSLIPFIGYWLAKWLNANGQVNKYTLFIFGVGVGLIENSLFYFDFLAKEQNIIGTFIVFFLFFIIAFISTNKTEFDTKKENC